MKKIALILFTVTLFISCSGDDDNQPVYVPAEFENGILITNEGPFNNGSGTVTFISDDYTTVVQNIYRAVNGSNLGNLVQSMGFDNNNAYIVVSNSHKIVVANRYTFEGLDSIQTGLENPRYFAEMNGKGYVSNWGDPTDNTDDYVALIDLQTNEVSATIPVSFGPEKLIEHNGKIYVAHAGGYGQNNLLSVISGNSVEQTITVGDVPNSMVVDGNSLYVLCSGNPIYAGTETAGSLVKIDLSTGQVSQTYTFETTEHPSSLTMDGGKLYYALDGNVYTTDSAAISLPGTPIIDGSFYALQAKDGKLYATDARDYASRGYLLIYDLATYQQLQDFQTGIIPGGIYFNN